MKTATPSILVSLALAWVAISPAARAVVPPPDGGYPGFTTAEGTNALKNLTSGVGNTAVGWFSLFSDTTASYNTGVGAGTLPLNTADFNTASGAGALLLNTTGTGNTANGAFALVYNDNGSSNTAVGNQALFASTTGSFNTATGSFALTSNNTGSDNTAVGAGALENNTGSGNTAVGSQALLFNTMGIHNTATGFQALSSNTITGNNTANGYQALFSNTQGANNTAVGYGALESNTTGLANTANGVSALAANETGNINTATGAQALTSNIGGVGNVADGSQALLFNTSGISNTACGANALSQNTTGSNNIALGVQSGQNLTTGDDNIHIGNHGFSGESAHIRIGTQGTQSATFIAGIHGATVASGVTVVIGTDGHLGTVVSSQRFKDEIKPMDKASEDVFALKPVTFRYKQEVDPERIPQFGLVAEEVERVNPDLIVRDKEGKPYSVRYDQVNAMLLNEFLKEHRKVQNLETTLAELKTTKAREETAISDLRNEVHALTAQLKAQAKHIQKVSALID